MGRAILAVCLALVAAACGGTTQSHQSGLRIYDPAGRIDIEVTSADTVGSSARAVLQGGGSASVYVAFTSVGVSKFCRLTRALARRGAALHQRQRFAVEIDNRVRRPFVDYEATPSGVCGAPGMEMTVMNFAAALKLAQLIREGTTSD